MKILIGGQSSHPFKGSKRVQDLFTKVVALSKLVRGAMALLECNHVQVLKEINSIRDNSRGRLWYRQE